VALLTFNASLSFSTSFHSHRHGLKLIQSYMLHAGQDPYLPVTLSKSSQPASHSIPRACTCAAKPLDWTTLLVGNPPSPDPRSVPGEVSRRPACSQHSGIRGLASSTRPSALLSPSLFQSRLLLLQIPTFINIVCLSDHLVSSPTRVLGSSRQLLARSSLTPSKPQTHAEYCLTYCFILLSWIKRLVLASHIGQNI